jgi:DNA-directed RNA polymerase subunit K/omega
MSNIKKKAQGLNSSIEARDVTALANSTGNIYETIVVISKRATQISNDLRNELKEKLEEFAPTTDNLEEIHENKEQIEISRFYEKMPNPALLSLNDYMNGQILYRQPSEDDNRRHSDMIQ